MALMIAHAEVGEFENAFAVEQDSVKLAQKYQSAVLDGAHLLGGWQGARGQR